MELNFRDELIKKCPNLYSNGICFETEKGWNHLIEELSLQLEILIEKMKDECPDLEFIPYATQVKEKYGCLSFSMSSYTDEMANSIYLTEKKSRETCEKCGKSGKIRKEFWIYVSCDDCLT